MIYKYKEIQHLHLEVSSLCNAICPRCPRNCCGTNHNFGFTERNLTLSETKQIFSHAFLQQIKFILINGNLGDMVMNPETPDIVQYFLACNPDIEIQISTNGGARNKQFWKNLVHPNVSVVFCIDGLADTHSKYRRNTVYSTVLENAKTYISAGGNAEWKMIVFDHNKHQISQCEKLSAEYGFTKFYAVNNSHGSGPIVDSDFNVIDYIDSTGPLAVSAEYLTQVPEHKVHPGKLAKKINCEVKKSKSLYVNAQGDVYPCCYLGFNPKTFNHPGFVDSNQQIASIEQNNNALTHGLEECISWFDDISDTWSKNWDQGRLIGCNRSCGAND